MKKNNDPLLYCEHYKKYGCANIDSIGCPCDNFIYSGILRHCGNCINWGKMDCPNSFECYARENKPYYEPYRKEK